MLKFCCDCIFGSSIDTQETTSKNTIRLLKPLNEYESIEIMASFQKIKESFKFTLWNKEGGQAGSIEFNFKDKFINLCNEESSKKLERDPALIIPESEFTLKVLVEKEKNEYGTDNTYNLIISVGDYDIDDARSLKNIANISYFEISEECDVTGFCLKYV